METFKSEGKEFWKKFGISIDLLPRTYFDFVARKQYEKFLKKYKKYKKYNLKNKKVIDIGAGFPIELFGRESAPLASYLQEVIESYGAKIIAVDVSEMALKFQYLAGRLSILASAFNLPFESDSIDGGAIILNLFNASFQTSGV